MAEQQNDWYDLVVIGAGPGGYVCAIRAAQLGLKTALVEKSPSLGGTCLNVGCIPSKALLDSSERYHQALHGLSGHGIKVEKVSLDLASLMRRKDEVVTKLTGGVAQLVKGYGITLIKGTAQLLGYVGGIHKVKVDNETELGSRNLVIATGSEAMELPGLEFDGKLVISSTEALSLSKTPKHLGIIGAGAIGLEMASVWARLGAKVTVVEMAGQILPGWEPAIAKGLQKELEKLGINFFLGNKAKIVKKTAAQLTLELDKGGEAPFVVDKLLVAVGRRAYTQGLSLETAGVQVDSRGKITVDKKFRVYGSDRAEESLPGLYAIGDVVTGPMLAHKAEEEGVAVAEILAGQAGHVDHDIIPGVVYTWPEAAMVGKTEEQLKAEGIEYHKGSFALGINSRALAMGESGGAVTILADKLTDRILGAHIWGPWASELIAEIVVLMELKGSAEDLGRIIHAHPTLTEAIKEAALAVHGRSIHGVNRRKT